MHLYQLAIDAPAPPDDSFDTRGSRARQNAIRRAGTMLGAPRSAALHRDFQANRAPDARYRTTPLKGLWTHPRRGFYHDGRFATPVDLLEHDNAHFSLGLSSAKKSELAEYLKSL